MDEQTFVRFWTKVSFGTGCWEWTACRNQLGYGKFGLNRRTREAYRVAYEALEGPVPPGLTLDHLCRNPACVRPAHLEPVTRRENTLRSPITRAGANARKTACPKGHPYNATHGRVDAKSGKWNCRTCHTQWCRTRYRTDPAFRARVVAASAAYRARRRVLAIVSAR